MNSFNSFTFCSIAQCIVKGESEKLWSRSGFQVLHNQVIRWHAYFRLDCVCYPNSITNTHKVSPQVLPTVVSWHCLKPNISSCPFLTSIQCAVTPRKAAFMVSTVHMSAIVEILPGDVWKKVESWVSLFERPLTMISFLSCTSHLTNSLWRWLMTSQVVGRSCKLDFGHIATKQLWNIVLSATERDYGRS